MTGSGMGLAEALQLPQQAVEDLDRDELRLTPAEAQAAGRLWLALLGVDDDGGVDARSAWSEVVDDLPLAIALHRPAAEFLRWWRAAAREDFGRDGDAWAWAVCDAARRGCTELGPWLGRQLPLTAELVWQGACGPL